MGGGGDFEDFLIHTQENTKVLTMLTVIPNVTCRHLLLLLGFEPRFFDIQIQHSTDQAIGLIKLKIKGEGYRG